MYRYLTHNSSFSKPNQIWTTSQTKYRQQAKSKFRNGALWPSVFILNERFMCRSHGDFKRRYSFPNNGLLTQIKLLERSSYKLTKNKHKQEKPTANERRSLITIIWANSFRENDWQLLNLPWGLWVPALQSRSLWVQKKASLFTGTLAFTRWEKGSHRLPSAYLAVKLVITMGTEIEITKIKIHRLGYGFSIDFKSIR